MKSLGEVQKVMDELHDKMLANGPDKTSKKITKLCGKFLNQHRALLAAEQQDDLEKMTQIRADGDLLSKQLDEAISESKTT